MNRRVVDKKPVFLFPVIAKRLTVIAQNHDETLLINLRLFEELDELA